MGHGGQGGVGIAITGGIAVDQTGGEENNNKETYNNDKGVEDNKEDYNTMVAMVAMVTTITILVLLACI